MSTTAACYEWCYRRIASLLCACGLSVLPLFRPPPVPGFPCHLMSNVPVIFHFVCLTSTFYANLDTFVGTSPFPFTNITAYNRGLAFFHIFVLFPSLHSTLSQLQAPTTNFSFPQLFFQQPHSDLHWYVLVLQLNNVVNQSSLSCKIHPFIQHNLFLPLAQRPAGHATVRWTNLPWMCIC